MIVAQFREVLGDLEQGAVLLNSSGLILAVNSAYLKLTGRRESDLLGRACAELHDCATYSPPGLSALRWLHGGCESPEPEPGTSLCEQCPLKAEREWSKSLAWLRLPERAEPIPVSVSYSRIRDRSGRLQNLLVFFQPLSELHRVATDSSAELRRLAQELTVAAAVERELVPYRWESVPGLEVARASLPLRPVGGDLLEGFRLSTGSVMYLGDISGKSLPGALLLPTVRRLCHRELQHGSPLSLKTLNQALIRALPDVIFLALTLVYYDGTALTVLNAGNEPPWLHRSLGGNSPLSQCQGMVLGVDPEASYAPTKIYLDQGDTLAMWTDGVAEALHRADQSPASWINQICQMPPGRLQQGVERLLWSLPREDDASILVLRR